MLVKKIIKTIEPVELEITGITLLSKEEYLKYRDRIPPRNEWWWLRSPYTDYDYNAGCVSNDGYVDDRDVNDTSVGVSPALICNLASSNLQIGDEFRLKGYTWTVISDKYAICNDIIGYHCFRDDWEAPDANIYEKSDVKRYLEVWWNEIKVVLD